MFLQSARAGGVEVLTVEGPVSCADAVALVHRVGRALTGPVRGVVVDLGAATVDDVDVRSALSGLSSLPSGWPHAALLVCRPPAGLVLGELVVVARPGDAMDHVDDRVERPREVLALGGGPASAAQARALVAASCDRLGLQEIGDDLALIASEMVTNAIRHAAPPVELEIEAGNDVVVVAVRDASPEQPVARTAGPDAEGGRGLLLVDQLSDAHGVRWHPPGKTVWASLRRRRAV